MSAVDMVGTLSLLLSDMLDLMHFPLVVQLITIVF